MWAAPSMDESSNTRFFWASVSKKGNRWRKLLTSQLDIEIKAAEAELVARQATLAEVQQARVEDIQRAEAMLAAKKAAYEYANAKLNRLKKTGRKPML